MRRSKRVAQAVLAVGLILSGAQGMAPAAGVPALPASALASASASATASGPTGVASVDPVIGAGTDQPSLPDRYLRNR